MDSAYITKVCKLFSKDCNINLDLVTQKLFLEIPSSRDITLNSKDIVVFKNPKDHNQIVHLARKIYPENF